MPHVPVVPTISTGLRPLSAPQRDSVNPNPFGQLGGALQQAGGDLAALVVQERRKADETRVTAVESRLSSFITEALSDPERGAFAKQGKNAIGVSDAILSVFDREAGASTKDLTAYQRQLVQPRLAALRDSLNGSLQRHELRERAVYDLDVAKTAITSAITRGMVDPNNVQALGKAEADVMVGVERLGTLQGHAPEVVAANRDKAVSSLYAGAVQRLLASDQVTAADQLFRAKRGAIAPDDAVQLEQALGQQTDLMRAQTVADTAVAQHGVNGRAARDFIRANTSGKVREHALGIYGREEAEREQEIDRARAHRGETIVQQAIAVGWDGLSKSDQAFAISRGLADNLIHAASGRPPATDPRYAGQAFSMREDDLQRIPRDQALAYIQRMSVPDGERWLGMWRGAQPNATTAQRVKSGAVIGFDDLTKVTARELGITKASDPAEKIMANATYVRFAREADTRRAAVAQHLGRDLTPDEYDTLVMQPLKMRVLTRDDWGTSNTIALPADVAPDDRSDFRVPLARIAPGLATAFREQTIPALAAVAGIAAPRITDAMVERYAALRARGLIPDTLTAASARALLEQVVR